MDTVLQASHLSCCAPALLWPAFACCPPVPLFGNGDFYLVLLYIVSTCFDFTGVGVTKWPFEQAG